LGVAIRQWY